MSRLFWVSILFFLGFAAPSFPNLDKRVYLKYMESDKVREELEKEFNAIDSICIQFIDTVSNIISERALDSSLESGLMQQLNSNLAVVKSSIKEEKARKAAAFLIFGIRPQGLNLSPSESKVIDLMQSEIVSKIESFQSEQYKESYRELIQELLSIMPSKEEGDFFKFLHKVLLRAKKNPNMLHCAYSELLIFMPGDFGEGSAGQKEKLSSLPQAVYDQIVEHQIRLYSELRDNELIKSYFAGSLDEVGAAAESDSNLNWRQKVSIWLEKNVTSYFSAENERI